MLARLPFAEWHRDYYKKLSGSCDGLWEIRFFADGVQQRLLGYRSDTQEFTILSWVREKNNRFDPPNACEQALRRKAEVLVFEDRVNALWLSLQ